MSVASNKKAITNSTQFKYTVGCDPELFLVDATGKFRSAHDLIPGEKMQPFRVSKGAIQPDGTSAEFNIDPAMTEEEFMVNIRTVLSELQKTVQKKDPSLSLKVSPVAFFDKDYFGSLPPSALAFGCTPDYNAWTGKKTKFVPTKETFRTGAGHVHVGWTAFEDVADEAHVFDCQEGTKQLDSVLFPMSLLWDSDEKRRTLYGKMGAYRPKSYGFEYRPLSNAWIADPDLHRWVYKATVKAMELLDSFDKPVRIWKDADLTIILQRLLEEKFVGKNLLLDYHEVLTKELDFEPLPPAYLEG